MKVLNRGLAILLAGVLILGGSAAFAVSPNANPNAMKMNPARIKVMEKVGKMLSEPEGIVVDEVDVWIIPMDNGNVGIIEGIIELDKGYDFEDFKGNTKIKVKLNNVTVNVSMNEDDEIFFSQPMPLWKAEILRVEVYVGKTLDYSKTLDDFEEIEREVDLEYTLRHASRLFERLDKKLDDLELDDLGLVKRARTVFDILEEEIGLDDDYDRLMEDYEEILLAAEDEMQELLNEMIEWEEEPELAEDDVYEGKLLIDEDLSDELDEILVIVELDDEDLEIEVGEDGEVSFETEETDFEVRVEFDGVVIEELTIEF